VIATVHGPTVAYAAKAATQRDRRDIGWRNDCVNCFTQLFRPKLLVSLGKGSTFSFTVPTKVEQQVGPS
jgi:hypothetical protein